MNWLHYDDDGTLVPLDDSYDINDCFGFVYKVTNTETGKIYIGKKSFFHNKKKKLTKKELAEQTGPGRKATTKIEQVDSGWRDYYGSSKELLADIKQYGKDKFQRIILDFCETKKQLTYSEVYNQMVYRVLFIDSYNDNIQGRFFRKDFA
jgi:uncharacterized protein YnzC (UPF0291/DUF896 family)